MKAPRWWRRYDRMPVVELQKSNPVRFGIVVIVVVVIAVYFGFTKRIPGEHGFRLNAAFNTALNIAPKSPVRIAGVNVGQVTSIKRVGDTGVVSMEISENGLPIHSDATLKIRPRLLLEGNWFVELKPGTPSAPTIKSGATIPVTQTSDPVQIDQVLDALNTDTRSNLQTFLIEYGDALTREPTPAENAEQNPAVRGLNAAQAIKKAYVDGVEALKNGTIVNQSFAGVEQNDLANLISGTEKFSAQLNVHEQQLGELIVNFNTFLGELAAQSTSLRQTVATLPAATSNITRAFAGFNTAIPSIKAFSLDLTPGVEQTGSTIAAAFPWIEQLKASLAPTELGGFAKALQSAAPALAGLITAQPGFFKEGEQFGKCLTNVLFPAGNAKLQDGSNTSGVEAYREFWYAMVGLSGIGQDFDGNGPLDRFMISTGNQTIKSAPASAVGVAPGRDDLPLLAHTSQPPLGTSPAFPSTEPPYKPLVACYTQAVPNFNGPLSKGPADGSGG